MHNNNIMNSETPTITNLCNEFWANNSIDPEISEQLGVKRGLRNPDGTGVLAGLTNICDVVGYEIQNNKRQAVPGKLIYRGVDVEDIVNAAYEEDRFVFEEVIWLLIFGKLPNQEQLKGFKQLIENCRQLPENFAEDMIMKAPSPNIMNKLARSVLALYSYDDNAEGQEFENILRQCMNLIGGLPTIMVNAYQIRQRVYEQKSMYLHMPKPGQSTAEHILSTYRADQKFTKEEAKLLDLCLVLHADHGGGNNSTFTCRVLSSSGTDTYSAISAAIGSLKGPKHGGANHKVMQMLSYIDENVKNEDDDDEILAFLEKLLLKQAGDKSGLIYGLGHAVYTKSDPRAIILRTKAKALAEQKNYIRKYKLLCAVERLGSTAMHNVKGPIDVCANVDLFSGLIYEMLGIQDELHTPLFAISRISGWCAHRLEEVAFSNRIIRPAYKYIGEHTNYNILEDRV